LLRPDAATNNAFLYCLIDAALRCEVDVLLPCAMSNHAVIYDRAARYPEFLEHFYKLLARSQNALRGRSQRARAVGEGEEVVGGGDAGVHPVDVDVACDVLHEEEREDHAPVPPIPGGPIRALDNQ
jgi:hypothetical protein